MLEKVLNTSLQLYLFHVLVLKKREDKPYQYQSIQKIFSKYTTPETYPWFPTTLTKTNQFENTFTYQILFRLNIFAINFSLKLIFFTVQMYLFD